MLSKMLTKTFIRYYHLLVN